MTRPLPKGVLSLACYSLLLLAADLVLPLRVPEILRALGARHFSWSRFIGWIAQTPGSAPLSYFAQLPFLLIWPYGRLVARFPPLIFAVATCILLFYLFKEIPIKRGYLAVAAFTLLPFHFQAATDARGFEQALFLTVLQTLIFFHLIRTPTLKPSVLYGIVLTLCLYTEPYSFLPAIGQFLFLLRFIGRAHERRAVWFALPATAVPPFLFVPYYLWARSQTSSNWISVPATQALDSGVYGLAILLIAGSLVAVWTTFRGMDRNPSKRIFLFCAAGGVGSTIAAGQILWAAPGFVLLFFAALEWFSTNRVKRTVASGLAILLMVCSLPSIAEYLGSHRDDLQRETTAISQRLTADSCIVFLSEGLSKELFAPFQPPLDRYECLNFFHRRVILAIHPYVSLKWRTDADSYFRAVNFHEVERVRVGEGEVVVLEQSR
jgi:hypothetical protein